MTSRRSSMHFNPRSPHGERHAFPVTRAESVTFQPTLPARGATARRLFGFAAAAISTHAPRTGSDRDFGNCYCLLYAISTHAPRTGSDARGFRVSGGGDRFQPTLPARGATGLGDSLKSTSKISTHAPRTGSDRGRRGIPPRPRHFNPRSPHGERPAPQTARRDRRDFNPRSPHGERQSGRGRGDPPAAHFNPRSPHGERRLSRARKSPGTADFNPRSPHGERQRVRDAPTRAVVISTHAPRTGSDSRRDGLHRTGGQFQPTLPARGATRLARFW